MRENITTIEGLATLIQQTMASKEDLKGLATQEDLKGLVTQEDLKGVKDDLHRLEQKVDAGFFAVNSRIDSLRNDISDLPDIREAVQDFQGVDDRLVRVERKLGFAQ
ncbi:MAG: hypothetical protein WAP52_02185 [Candidatus Sungiibacteriota bacterium]